MVTININCVNSISFGKWLENIMMWLQHFKTFNITVLFGKLASRVLNLSILSTFVIVGVDHFKQTFCSLLVHFLFVCIHIWFLLKFMLIGYPFKKIK